ELRHAIGTADDLVGPRYQAIARERRNPVVDQLDAGLIDNAGAHSRHAARAYSTDTIKQRRAIGIARSHDLRGRNVERPLPGPHVHDAHVAEFPRRDELKLGVASAPFAMAMRAICM